MSVTILQDISKYKKVITTTLEKMKGIHSGYVCKNLEWLRKNYDRTSKILETKTIEINKEKDYINECINNLENCRNSFSEMEKVIKEISIASNEARVGTLHGLCKELIQQKKIPMDEIEETVFNFPHDENKEIKNFKTSIQKIGGKNNTKRKNYIAKNVNNKKSKKRRLKCAKV
jgi:hypothetical protein